MSTTAVDQLNVALSGRYVVERELGEGGMATVYLANDVKHERSVALKVLKPELAAVVGAERFLAEIKTTANLQHPHILPLHDSGEADGFLYFVMPYVEGETLRDRLTRERQLPVDEAVRIATAIANALQTAHEQGIVHRDIKPANILLSRGEPLIADFGIALAVGTAGSRLTETGLSVGTPFYMSPEQATGDQAVGPATDTYALGAVLYEMLTGDPPFMGNTAQAVLGQIIAGEPVSAVKKRPSIPRHVDSVIRKALERLPADRFVGAHELARALADPGFRHGEEATGQVVASPGYWRPLALSMTAAALALLLTTLFLPRGAPDARVLRVSMRLADGEGLGFDPQGRIALSPDGSTLAYVGPGVNAATQLWVRDLSQLSATPLRGTDGACCPTFSPDGQSIAFFDKLAVQIKTVRVTGSGVLTIAEGRLPPDRLSWGPDGYIYTSALGAVGEENVLYRVPVTGGDAEPLTTFDFDASEGGHQRPMALPNGRGVLFVIAYGTTPSRDIAVLDLESGERRGLVQGLSPFFTTTGHLVYVTDSGVLMAAPFDQNRLEMTGTPAPIADGVATRVSAADVAISDSGTLIYAGGRIGEETVVWVDRTGARTPVEEGWVENFETVALSPAGDRLAVSFVEASGDQHLWVKRLPAGSLEKLTIEGGLNFRPFWSSDGERVLFVSDRGTTPNDLFVRPVSGGGAELVLDLERSLWEGEWSRDGDWLIYRVGIPPTRDLFVKHVHPDSVGRTISASDQFQEVMPTLSPDGRWLAYQSDETGTIEIYLRPFPNIDDDKRAVSNDGGSEPLWSRDGSELFYKNATGDLVAVRVDGSDGSVIERTVLFSTAQYQRGDEYCCHPTYDVHPDGERFIMIHRELDEGELILVQNFFTELRARVNN